MKEMLHLRQCGYGADLHVPVDKLGVDSWVMALSWKFNHDYGKKSFDNFWKFYSKVLLVIFAIYFIYEFFTK